MLRQSAAGRERYCGTESAKFASEHEVLCLVVWEPALANKGLWSTPTLPYLLDCLYWERSKRAWPLGWGLRKLCSSTRPVPSTFVGSAPDVQQHELLFSSPAIVICLTQGNGLLQLVWYGQQVFEYFAHRNLHGLTTCCRPCRVQPKRRIKTWVYACIRLWHHFLLSTIFQRWALLAFLCSSFATHGAKCV